MDVRCCGAASSTTRSIELTHPPLLEPVVLVLELELVPPAVVLLVPVASLLDVVDPPEPEAEPELTISTLLPQAARNAKGSMAGRKWARSIMTPRYARRGPRACHL